MMKYLILMTLIFQITSCNKNDNYVHHYDPPRVERSITETPIKTLAVDGNIDILWVIDNSGSMYGIQNNVIKNAKLFMSEFVLQKHINWKMGVISTDEYEEPFLGFDSSFDYTAVNLGDPSSVDSTVATFQDAVRSLGTNGSALELTFFNILRVIKEHSMPGALPFLRPSSHLAIIMVTDEKEQSVSRKGPSYQAASFLNTLSSFINTDKTLRFYGALQKNDLPECTDTWEAGDYAGSPFEEVINFTGGFHVSACTSDFGTKLVEIGKDIASLVKLPSLLLKNRPKVHTLKVFYKGEMLPAGAEEDGGMWYYDDRFQSINFYSMDFVQDVENDTFVVEFDIADGITRPTDPVYE